MYLTDTLPNYDPIEMIYIFTKINLLEPFKISSSSFSRIINYMCTIFYTREFIIYKLFSYHHNLAKKPTDDCSITKERVNLRCENVDTYLSNARMKSTIRYLSLFEGYS